MNRSDVLKSVKRVRDEVGVSKHIPITHLNSPSVFESSNSMMGSVIWLKGVPFDTEKDSTLNAYRTTWHRALTALGEAYCVYVTIHRHGEDTQLDGEFTNDFSREVDRLYHQKFQKMYVNDIYLMIVRKGITAGKMGKGLHVLNQFTHKTVRVARDHRRQADIKELTKVTHQLLASLSDFGPRLVGENDETYSELLSVLGLVVNGGQKIRFNKMVYGAPIGKTFVDAQKRHTLYPYGNVASYLSTQRIFFGQNIQFQGHQTTFATMLTIKRYGTESVSLMLDKLLHLDGDFISTHTFAFEPKEVAQKHIFQHMVKLENVNDPAISQIDQLHEARDQLASDQLAFGYHHNTVMLLGATQAELEISVVNMIKYYADAGFVAIRESLGQEPAFWAQIPTNTPYIARSAMISSQNFVDFAPLHNYRTGYRDGNHLGSAVTLLETPSKTPFFFNFHTKGTRDNPSKGHTTIIGGNGAGKTVLLGFLDAQANRYQGRTFVFDRDRGLEIYLRACGGYYAIISPDYAKEISFNPLQLEDTPVNRQFCREWMAQLVKQEDENTLDPDLSEQLANCIDYVFEQLSPKHRSLTNAAKILPLHFSRFSSLRRFLRADAKHPEGEYAYLFDNERDDLSMHQKMGFDMTHFLDQEPNKGVLAALTMYLFHRLEQSFDGRLVTVLLDEGWQYLDNVYWQQKLKRWLPTLRKLNCHLVFATQSPESVVSSPLCSMILDNGATNIYFMNPQAKQTHYMGGFNLTRSEFETIQENDQNTRLFLLKQEHESSLCRLDLSHMGDVLGVLSANKQSVNLLDRIRSKYGDDPTVWLPHFYAERKQLGRNDL